MHEAGHAVFFWRTGEALYGDAWQDSAAPFDCIILQRVVGRPITHRERVIDAAGVVAGLGCREFLTPDIVRDMIAAPLSGSRARRRAFVRRTKLAPQREIVCSLAGPVVEHRYVWGEPGYHWSDDFWEQQAEAELEGNTAATAGDVTKAFAFADAISRGLRQTTRRLDDAVAEIEEKLDADQRYWCAIEMVADALIARKRHRLSSTVAVQIMRKAWRG